MIAAAANASREPAAPSQQGGSGNASGPYGNWLDRMQRTRGRHAAIARNIYTWSNYKSWADKVREGWTEEGTPKEPRKPR
ncbi:MAG: hypothetical protein U1F11_14510 [Steroidobacteraceae bacterium]